MLEQIKLAISKEKILLMRLNYMISQQTFIYDFFKKCIIRQSICEIAKLKQSISQKSTLSIKRSHFGFDGKKQQITSLRLQMQQNLFLQFQQSIQNLNCFNERIILSIRQSNNMIENHLETLLGQQKFMLQNNKNKFSFKNVNNSEIIFQDMKTKTEEAFHSDKSQQVQQFCKSYYIIERKQNRQSQKQQKTKSKILSFIMQRRIMDKFFSTRFSELFQFDGIQDSKIYKKQFRDVFVKWLFEKEIITANKSDLNGDDLMLIQRILTNYIRDNLKDRCKIRTKFYSGLKFKNLPEFSGMF